MSIQVRSRRFTKSLLLALGAAAFQPSSADAKMIWSEVATPAPVTALAVGPNDVPFISTNGPVFYLGYNQGTCSGTPRLCQDKWISVPGVSAEQLFVTMDGEPYALDPSGRVNAAVQPNNANPATDIWVPGTSWILGYDWGSGCANAFAVSGYIATRPEAFRTPQAYLSPWDETYWAVGCGAGDDSPLWLQSLQYNPIGGIQTQGWQPLATRQNATSNRIAIFTRNEPIGPVQDVWFQDSLASGGGTWLYDQAHDKVINVPNPPLRTSTKPIPPLTRGSAITDHYARFRSASTNVGWVYRWDDNAGSWVYVAGDTTGGPVDLLAHSEAYNSSVGWIGPSRVWATDTSGRLYVLFDAGVVK